MVTADPPTDSDAVEIIELPVPRLLKSKLKVVAPPVPSEKAGGC